MSKRRSSLANIKKDVSANSQLENCLKDISCAAYQNSINFVEVVAFLNKFQKYFSIPAISFADIEQALDYEQQNLSLPRPEWVASKTLTDLYKSILKFFGINSEKFVTATQLNDALLKLLKKYRSVEELQPDETVLKHLYETDANLEVCSLSAEQKLSMLTVFIDAFLDSDQAQALTQSFAADDLRITPIAVDSQMNKLWYFGDTYLFLEHAEQSEPVATKKRRSNSKIVTEIAQANTRLFTANKLNIVCKTSGDWTRLIDAYKRETDVCNSISLHVDAITALENKRLKQEMLNAAISRTSSRIQQKAEEKRREEELAKVEREQQKKREMEQRRRLEEERLKNLYSERGKATTSIADLESVSQVEAANTMSREERLQLREQRKLEQNLNISRDSRPSNSLAPSSSDSVFHSKNGVKNRQSDASNVCSSSSSSPSTNKSDLPQGAQLCKNSDVSQHSREPMYPSSRFSEADKSKIRNALGIQKTVQMNPVSKPSSSTQLNGFELANVKKYMKRPGEVPQQQALQRVLSPPNNSGYVWAPVRNSPNIYAIGRPINDLPNGHSRFVSAANYRVLDPSYSVNYPSARPIKYIVPVKQYVTTEHDYSRNSFSQYSSEEQEESEYQVQWSPTHRSFNR